MSTKTNSWVQAERLVGGAWLCHEFDVQPVQPLRYVSRIGGSNIRRESNGRHENKFQPGYAPDDTIAGHLEFMLKHERIHLELLSRLFGVAGENEISQWVSEQPTGQYSRRAGWLYEWLTGKQLDVPHAKAAPYVDALEADRYWTSEWVAENKLWRVRDNMPGTPSFCSTVLLSDSVKAALKAADIHEALANLESQFGETILRRAAMWLTSKESRSSFEIEGEHDLKREERFARAMETSLGKLDDLFGEDLIGLQREVLGSQAFHYGLRKSPVFVGQTTRHSEIVHYVAPDFQAIPSMMHGLTSALERTEGTDALIRAATLSFGFVYIHPLADGNGRLSRFIVNDVFRRDGAVADPLLVPISAVITADMASYDRVLDTFSAPLRHRYSRSWRFAKDATYADGVHSNFEFDEYADALHAWRYIDLTDHVVYMAGIVGEALRREMHQEADFLRKHYLARERLNQVIEAGDNTLDRIIRSIGENKRISGKLAAEYPQLADSAIAEQAVGAVLSALDE